jgi:hypothetical protein
MSSMANGDIKTMNPADKFMTPRAPPPTPKLARLNTSTSVLAKQRTARSLSPTTSEKPQWSPRMFFGLRSLNSKDQDADRRGRSSSLSKVQADASASTPSLVLRSEEMRKVRSVPHTREVSPQSFKKTSSREPSPLRQLFPQEISTYNSTSLVIPDEIAEEAEDDDNFASQVTRMSINEKGIFTPLSPPPAISRPPMVRAKTATNTSKPLPQLPEDLPLLPTPLRLRSAVSAAELPRSHFSTSTISTTISSPSDSSFSFGEDLNEDEDLTADSGSGDEFTYSPVLSEAPAQGFSAYSLPEDQYASEQTLRKETPITQLTRTASRATFGSAPPFLPNPVPDAESMSTLEQLMHDMGYLGDVIVGK